MQNGPFLNSVYCMIGLQLLMHYCFHHFNVAAGKIGADFMTLCTAGELVTTLFGFYFEDGKRKCCIVVFCPP